MQSVSNSGNNPSDTLQPLDHEFPKQPFNRGLLENADALQAVIDVIPHPVFIKNGQSRFLIVNSAFCALMGRDAVELVGKDDYPFVPEDEARIFRATDREVLQTGESRAKAETFTDSRGVKRTIVTSKRRITLSDGLPLVVACISDMSDLVRATAMIRTLEFSDELTGLPNRRALLESMATTMQASPVDSVHALLEFDLRRFKSLNDAYGKEVGDLVLCEVARRLEESIGRSDIIARRGDDKFAIFSLMLDPVRVSAEVLAGRLLMKTKIPIGTNSRTVEVSASIGIAMFPYSVKDPLAFLQAAELATYRAKQDGFQNFRFYDPCVDKRVIAPCMSRIGA